MVAAALVALPFLISPFWTFIAIEVLAFALYAVSFNVLLSYGGMLSFGHAAFFGVGGYAVALLMKRFDLAMPLALIGAPFVAAGFALVIGYFSVRRTGIYFAMLTFAFQMLLYTVAMKATGITGGDDGISGIKAPGLLANPTVYYLFALVVVAAALYMLARLVDSPFGYTLRALRVNPRRVQAIGIDLRAHQLATFVITGAFAGLAGALFAVSSGNVFPSWLNWTASATPIVMALLGGLGSFVGPIIGAAVYVLLEIFISGHTEYWPLVMGSIIIALLVFLPQGIISLAALNRRGSVDRH